MFVTLVGFEKHVGIDVIKTGQKLNLVKDYDNLYDEEAIKVLSDRDVIYGYVANSVSTVAKGTHSAGYIYRDFEERTTCTVKFVTEDVVIAEVD